MIFRKYLILLNIFNWRVNLTMHEEAVTPLQHRAEIKISDAWLALISPASLKALDRIHDPSIAEC